MVADLRRGAVAALILSTIALASAPASELTAVGACGFPELVVADATQGEVHEVCAAVAVVRALFADMGFGFDPRLTIAFRDDVDAERGDRHAHGWYDPATHTATVHARKSAWPWGEPWAALAGSFLRHEVTHAAVAQILGSRFSSLAAEWHEFIAYAVQFELMNPALRERILVRHQDVEPVRALSQINVFTYGMSEPDVFGVLVYRSYQAFGGKDLLRRLLAGEFVPTPLDQMLPFPIR